MLSVAQDNIVLKGRMVVNNILVRVLKKAVEAAFEVSSQCSLQGIRKTTNLSEEGLCPDRDLSKVHPGFKQNRYSSFNFLGPHTHTHTHTQTQETVKCASSETVFRLRSQRDKFPCLTLWLLYVPPGLTLKDFYVLPTQCTFVYFVWISEQTAIISLHNIKLTQNEGVYSAVRSVSWNLSVILVLKDLRLKCHWQCTIRSIKVPGSYDYT
jgi:hypothetical protein